MIKYKQIFVKKLIVSLLVFSFFLSTAPFSKIAKASNPPLGRAYLDIPVKTDLHVGDSFSVIVKADTDGYIVYGVKLFMTFNPAIMRIDSVVPNGNFDVQYQDLVDNVNGLIREQYTTSVSNGDIGTSINLFQINFTIISAGVTNLAFDSANCLLINGDLINIWTIFENGLYGTTTSTYTVSASATGAGLDATVKTVAAGTNAIFNVTPLAGYHFVSVNMGTYDPVSKNWTISNVTSDITGAHIQFEINTYNVTAAIIGGTLSQSNFVGISYGDNVSINVVPNAGQHFVSVNYGNYNETTKVWTISNVTSNISDALITFSPNSYIINVYVTNGIASPFSKTVLYGDNTTFNITPDSGSIFVSTSAGTYSAGVLTVNNITSDVNIDLVFTAPVVTTDYVLVATAGEGGTITPNGSIAVQSLESKTFNFYPDLGYEIDKVMVDSVNQGAINTYTFSNISSNHTINVSFKLKEITVNVLFDPTKGEVIGGGINIVKYGSDFVIDVTPKEGYEVDKVAVNGVSYSLYNNRFILSNVVKDTQISVTFKVKTTEEKFILKIVNDETKGYVVPNGSIEVGKSEQVDFTIKLVDGWKISSIKLNDVEQEVSNPFILRGIDKDSTIEFFYSPIVEEDNVKIYVTFKNGTGTIKSDDTILTGDNWIEVKKGIDTKVNIVPTSGFYVKTVTADGLVKGVTNFVDYKDIQKDSNIVVELMNKKPKILTFMLKVDVKQMWINHLPIDIDTAPRIKQDRTFVPIRKIIEYIGGKIQWLPKTRQVIIDYDGKRIDLTIGKATALLNGKTVPIDANNSEVVSYIDENNRTLLPLRFVTESLGIAPIWDSVARTITLVTIVNP